MARRFQYPHDPEYWIDLPAEWLGIHANRRDQAAKVANELELKPTLQSFSVAMSLLDDWHLPGINGNPENWDFNAVSLQVIAWVNTITIADFSKCWQFPKDFFLKSPDG